MVALPLTVDALSFEEHTWLAECDGIVSRSRLATSSGEYRSAVLSMIAERSRSDEVNVVALGRLTDG
ncbi:MAG: hypothetical protein ACTMIR_12930 [Cellulomonadaceae bacterium]